MKFDTPTIMAHSRVRKASERYLQALIENNVPRFDV